MIIISTGCANKLLGTGSFKATFTNGVLYVYSGPQPASADAAVRGTLLGIITLNAAAFAFGTATNGLNFDAPTASTKVINKAAAEAWQMGDGAGVAGAVAAGTAGWFRMMGNAADALGASTTLARIDGSIATSGADLNLPNIDFVIGTPVTIDVFRFTLPLFTA